MGEQSTIPARRRKAHRTKTQWKEGGPPRPYPDFPLSPYATGTWCKRIKGKLYHFGRWARRVNGKLERVPGDGWEEALKLYKYQVEAIVTGKPKPLPSDQLTVADLCCRFHTAKRRKLDAAEMTARSFGDYCRTTDLIVEHFGAKGLVVDLTSADFEQLRAIMAKRWGAVRLGNEIGRVCSVFKYAFDYRLITHPVHFGNEFVKPRMAADTDLVVISPTGGRYIRSGKRGVSRPWLILQPESFSNPPEKVGQAFLSDGDLFFYRPAVLDLTQNIMNDVPKDVC